MSRTTCSSCNKTYKNLNSLLRHKERCILINPDMDLLMRETENTPYTRRIIASLLGRLSVLEDKIDRANRFITREKRKINILDYLNKQEKTRALKAKTESATPEATPEATTFSSIKKQLVINNEQLNYYLENPPIIGLVKILINNLETLITNKDSKPFRSFTQKRSTVYIREFDETHKKYYWLELIEWTDYERLIFIIQQKLLKIYEQRHNEKLNRQHRSGQTEYPSRTPQTNAKNDDHYFENIKKILLTNQHGETTSKYFKQRLYEELRENIEIDYEVIF